MPDLLPREDGGFCRIGLIGGCKAECLEARLCPVETSGVDPHEFLIEASLKKAKELKGKWIK